MKILGLLFCAVSGLAGCGPYPDGVPDTTTADAAAEAEPAAPRFRAPLGSGTTVDLEEEPCVEIAVVVEDGDSAWVELAQDEPLLGGATLVQTAGHEATWRWCPTAAQTAEAESWTVSLSATDGVHAPVVKHYLIVALRAPGEAPEDPPPDVCADDGAEEDDDATFARRVDHELPHVAAGSRICSGDDDWYRIYLYGGERVQVALGFTQTGSDEDLDLHLYWGSVDLTPCDESAPDECDGANGQGTTSNENLGYTVGASGWYYVVVHGWDGAENDYAICIGLSTVDCPPLP
jgi:hypothetical protein